MKKVALLVAICLMLAPLAAFADEATFKAKCVACHGSDGKKNAKADLTSDKAKKLTEDEIVKFLTTHGVHKSKVADANVAKSLAKYVKGLQK